MKRSPLKKMSSKASVRMKTYLKARKEYMEEHPCCEICNALAVCIHHKKGKLGDLLWDKRFFMSTCFNCHRRIEDNRAWGYEMGYLLDRLSNEGKTYE